MDALDVNESSLWLRHERDGAGGGDSRSGALAIASVTIRSSNVAGTGRAPIDRCDSGPSQTIA
jgi:hypothetical protein